MNNRVFGIMAEVRELQAETVALRGKVERLEMINAKLCNALAAILDDGNEMSEPMAAQARAALREAE